MTNLGRIPTAWSLTNLAILAITNLSTGQVQHFKEARNCLRPNCLNCRRLHAHAGDTKTFGDNLGTDQPGPGDGNLVGYEVTRLND